MTTFFPFFSFVSLFCIAYWSHCIYMMSNSTKEDSDAIKNMALGMCVGNIINMAIIWVLIYSLQK